MKRIKEKVNILGKNWQDFVVITNTELENNSQWAEKEAVGEVNS